jgi:hypothetical protein
LVIASVRAFVRAGAERKEDRMTHEFSFATANALRGTARVRTDAPKRVGNACADDPSSRALAFGDGMPGIGQTNMRRRVFIAGGDP